jgi:hypothetical protein
MIDPKLSDLFSLACMVPVEVTAVRSENLEKLFSFVRGKFFFLTYS